MPIRSFMMLGLFKVRPCSDPNAPHRNGHTPYHHHRAHVGAGVHIPCPLLREGEAIYEDWMHATSPEQERRRPSDVSEELVVQTSRAQAANDDC